VLLSNFCYARRPAPALKTRDKFRLRARRLALSFTALFVKMTIATGLDTKRKQSQQVRTS
jgi:hypothetical protein